MNIGVIGLGLIGGSLAKAVKQYTGHTVLGADIDAATRAAALRDRAVDDILLPENYAQCQVLLAALYPAQTIHLLSADAARIAPGTLVVDCCGVKQPVCAALEPLARRYGFTFIGGHPMAGVERSGYAAAAAELFAGASMILTPPAGAPPAALSLAEELFLQIGFRRVQYADAAEHDRMIAYTSQLAHVVSSAYVQSEAAARHLGFSAGSFQDMTRVALLAEGMWSELFLANRDCLLAELDGLTQRLGRFREALQRADKDALYALLRQGRVCKEELNALEQAREERNHGNS